MSNYYLGPDGNVYSEDELYHYGVPGMKWGVRKDKYRQMTTKQRRQLQNDHFSTEQGKADLKRIQRNTTIGTIIAGPIGGLVAGFSTLKRVGESVASKSGSKRVSELASKAEGRTESKRVASLKSSVTGKKENGKPAFLMSSEERADFDRKYQQQKKTIASKLSKTSDSNTRAKLIQQSTKLEKDYLSVVEQDFWYRDD